MSSGKYRNSHKHASMSMAVSFIITTAVIKPADFVSRPSGLCLMIYCFAIYTKTQKRQYPCKHVYCCFLYYYNCSHQTSRLRRLSPFGLMFDDILLRNLYQNTETAISMQACLLLFLCFAAVVQMIISCQVYRRVTDHVMHLHLYHRMVHLVLMMFQMHQIVKTFQGHSSV